MALRRSASLPGFSSRLLEGILFVADGCGVSGPSNWRPLRFAHNSDGSLSFAAHDGAATEIFLDADWRQPFSTAPWKPVTSSQGQLYPFSLSYQPLPGRKPPPESQENGPARRTLMLAAPSEQSRRRWLTSIARKLGSAQLRPSGTYGEIGDFTDEHPKKRFVQLGQMQTLQKKGASDRRLFRLPPARAELWEETSSLSLVRDLYEGYASDPLTAAGRPLRSRAGERKPEPPDEFMSLYLEKQAAIESMLHQSHWKAVEEQTRREAEEEEARRRAEEEVEAARPPEAKEQKQVQTVPHPGFEILARTANTRVEGSVLQNSEWSGGAIFARACADDPSFELSIYLLDSPKTHPVFIGMAPPGANLCQANFFSSCGGVFLCLGGRASEGKLGALGAPGGPFVQGFGYRLVADLPKGHVGCTVQVNYTEAVDSQGCQQGHVCFMVSDSRGRLHQHKPQLRQSVPSNVGWLPCLLLCNPDTRVRVKQLA